MGNQPYTLHEDATYADALDRPSLHQPSTETGPPSSFTLSNVAAIATALDRKLRARATHAELARRGILRRQFHGYLWCFDYHDAARCTCMWTVRACSYSPRRRLMEEHDAFGGDRSRASQPIALIDHGFTFVVCTHTISGDLVAAGRPNSIDHIPICSQHRRAKRAICHSAKSNICRLPGGYSSASGQLDSEVDSNHESISSLPHSRLLTGSRVSVRQLACGLSHCLALTQHDMSGNQLQAWGFGAQGQLGLGGCTIATAISPITTSPSLTTALAASSSRFNSVRLRCGPLASCLAITEASGDKSTVWLWGLLPSRSRHPNRQHAQASSLISQRTPSDNLISCSFRMVDIRVGMEHVTLLSSDGIVYTWGNGSCGQRGVGLERSHGKNASASTVKDDRNALVPTSVPFQYPNTEIDAIACGFYHSLALDTRSGNVFAWGSNRFGACGAKTRFHEYFQPVLTFSTSNLREGCTTRAKMAIHCRGNTSICVVSGRHESKNDRVFVWGVSGATNALLIPTEVSSRPSSDSSTEHVFSAGYGCIHVLQELNDYRSSGHGTICSDSGDGDESPRAHGFAVISSNTNDDDVRPLHQSWPPQTLQGHLPWWSIAHRRIRVYKNAKVILLVQIPDFSSKLQICTQHRLTGVVSSVMDVGILESTPPSMPSFALVYLTMDTVGAFDVRWCRSMERALNEQADSIILSIDCCLHLRDRRRVMIRYRGFVSRKYSLATGLETECTEPQMEGTHANDTLLHQRSHFAALVSQCLQHAELREAIAWSPLSTPADEVSQQIWDYDQAADEIAHGMRVSTEHANIYESSVFALWAMAIRVVNGEADDSIEDSVSHQQKMSLGTLDMDPQLKTIVDKAIQERTEAEAVSSNWVLKYRDTLLSGAGTGTDTGKERAVATRSEISVPQGVVDLLVRSNSSPKTLTAGHTTRYVPYVSELTSHTNEESIVSAVTAWWSDRGELFFADKMSSIGHVHVYDDRNLSSDGYSSPTSNRMRYWRQAIHAFLWKQLQSRSWSVRTMFTLWKSSFKAASPPTTGSIIAFQAFKDGLTTLGFPVDHIASRGHAPPRGEEWFVLFTMLAFIAGDSTSLSRAADISASNCGVCFASLRSFLMDPGHSSFWRRYLDGWQRSWSASVSGKRMAMEAVVVETLRPMPSVETAECQSPLKRLPWAKFLSALYRIHQTAELPLSASDACRLLYHFDSRGDGEIRVDRFQDTLLMLGRPAQSRDTKLRPIGRRRPRRPQADAFATPAAVRKLFEARSKSQLDPYQPLREHSARKHKQIDGVTRLRRDVPDTSMEEDRRQRQEEEINALRRMGNTRLAQIRNLPVSQLLSEGVFFRASPPSLSDSSVESLSSMHS